MLLVGIVNLFADMTYEGVVPAGKRSTAFGVFDTGFGIAWFVGSAAMGRLYDRSVVSVVLLSVALQLAALPVLFLGERVPKRGSPAATSAV